MRNTQIKAVRPLTIQSGIKSLCKGDKIYIEGKIKTEKYTDKQGVEKYTTKIIAREIQMLGSKHDNGAAPPPERTPNDSRNHRTQQAPPPPMPQSDGFDDDVPF